MFKYLFAFLLLLPTAALADKIDGAIGEGSQFHQTYGYYAQGVGPETAVLPNGWIDRVHRVQSAGTNQRVGYCLDPLDLFMSKAAAGRDKDREFCMAMPMDDAAQRRLKAAVRRWVKTVREQGHDVPEA